MKAVFSLIALAATALAQDILPRGDRGDTPKSVTQTVITTTTVCPITSTYTEHGKTSIVTYLTTSTLTITSCPGGECGGVVTVPGPTGVASSTTQVLTTYTTICPVTETITAPGTTYTKVYTTTSTIVTHIENTVDVTKTLPDVTTSALSYVYSTSTSYCPVTETKTVSGQVVTVVYTSTSLIVTQVPKTIEQVTTVQPPPTTAISYVYSTSTSYCP
ncbi:hypothetical protein B0J14DRAFT_219654 [Halenospora varia]|nr:hypothetical protein B0J14DRAFT_219654 [Halenospora varia]